MLISDWLLLSGECCHFFVSQARIFLPKSLIKFILCFYSLIILAIKFTHVSAWTASDWKEILFLHLSFFQIHQYNISIPEQRQTIWRRYPSACLERYFFFCKIHWLLISIYSDHTLSSEIHFNILKMYVISHGF